MPRAGRHNGRITDAKTRSSPAPSMRAASSSSIGISFMNSVITTIDTAHAPTGMIIPQSEPIRSTCSSGRSPRTSDSGIARISSGSIIVDRINTSTTAAPRNRLRANAYAANTVTVTWSSRPPPATSNELRSSISRACLRTAAS